MAKGNLKKIDLLRKRRDTDYFAEPYFIDTKKYIKKGLISGFVLIIISLSLGLPFVFRINYLENKKEKLREFSDQYDLLEKKLDKESKQLKEISKFNNNLKDSIINISSSSALFQEIALIIPKSIQLLEFSSKGSSLNIKAELSKFEDFDLKKIQFSQNNPENENYLVDIKTKVSTKYSDINSKYLTKLGSYGLLNRLNMLKNIDEPLN